MPISHSHGWWVLRILVTFHIGFAAVVICGVEEHELENMTVSQVEQAR